VAGSVSTSHLNAPNADEALLPGELEFDGFVIYKNAFDIITAEFLLTPERVEGAMKVPEGQQKHEVDLVFLNSCAGANDLIFTASKMVTAFNAKNYISWPTPTWIVEAAPAASLFFARLDGGFTADIAVQGITATAVITNRAVAAGLGGFGTSQLTNLKKNPTDNTIFDLTIANP